MKNKQLTKEEILREFIARKNSPMADVNKLYKDREQLLWWDTNSMTTIERELLNEALR